MADRLESYRKLCEEHGVEPGRSNTTTADEDSGMYFLPEDDEDHKPIKRYVAVTASGEYAYLYGDFDTLGGAAKKAVEFTDDSLYPEVPQLIVDLDTGKRYRPRWSSLVWRPL